MNPLRHASCVCLAVLLLVACSRNEAPPPLETHVQPPPAPSAPAPAPATLPSSEPEGSSTRLPTEEDFEDESAAKVTPQTLDAQLDALEKEIQAE